MEQKLEIGAAVVYLTPTRQRVNALVTAVHAAYPTAEEHKERYGSWPCINVLFITPDAAKRDPYGRQSEHASSVSHGREQGVPVGNCWFWPSEE
jgi:hypothetical protein